MGRDKRERAHMLTWFFLLLRYADYPDPIRIDSDTTQNGCSC